MPLCYYQLKVNFIILLNAIVQPKKKSILTETVGLYAIF